jgi:hypothetical protein
LIFGTGIHLLVFILLQNIEAIGLVRTGFQPFRNGMSLLSVKDLGEGTLVFATVLFGFLNVV